MTRKIVKPMLAETADMEAIVFPVLATPKLDGIRCLTFPAEQGCSAVSRKLKPTPNDFIRNWINENLPAGLDGELVVVAEGENAAAFHKTSGGVMSTSGEPDFRYLVFDYVRDSEETPYEERMRHLAELRLPRQRCIKLLPVLINSMEELVAYETKCLAEGHEGVMIRAPHGPYKQGRATVQQGWLLKVKKFTDAEGEVIGFAEGMKNGNEKTVDALGHAKRSTHQSNMIPLGTLGAIKIRDLKTGAEFHVGTGFDHTMRREYWGQRDSLMGKIVKYKYQAVGTLLLPRFPVFIGFRHEDDMGE